MKKHSLHSRKTKLYKQAVLRIILLFFIPFSLLGLYFYQEQACNSRKQVLQSELNTINSIGFSLDTRLRELQQDSLLFYQNAYLQSFLQTAQTKSELSSNIQKLDSYFSNFFCYNKVISAVSIRRCDGMTFTSSSDYADISDEEYQEILRQTGKITFMGIKYSKLRYSSPFFVFSRKLYDINDIGKAIGAIEYYVSQDLLFPFFDSDSSTISGSYAIYSNDLGSLLFSNGEDSFFTNFDTNLIEQTPNGIVSEQNGYIVSCYPIPTNPRWYLVHVNTDTTSGKSFVFLLLGTLLLGIFASFMLSFWLQRHVFARLNMLSKGMQNIEKEQYSERLPLVGNDEITTVTQGFNHMSNNLEELINQVYLGKLHQKDAQIKLLRAYINPHFLFNTLDTICWMSRMENAFDTCSLVEALSHLFRNSLDNTKACTKVKTEIADTKEYLKIQECRYSDQIEFNVSCTKEIEDCITIGRVLQPLIENAILHGFTERQLQGTIWIDCFAKDDTLFFVVEDDGADAPITEMNALLENYEEGKRGFALYGTNERIQLHFGKDYGIAFHPFPPHGLRAVVTQPLLKEWEEKEC
jgi:two-component system sensor histidine kinase YesM